MPKRFDLATFHDALTPDILSEVDASDIWYEDEVQKQRPFVAGRQQIFARPLSKFQRYARPVNAYDDSQSSRSTTPSDHLRLNRKKGKVKGPTIEEITDSTEDYEDASDVWLSEAKGDSDRSDHTIGKKAKNDSDKSDHTIGKKAKSDSDKSDHTIEKKAKSDHTIEKKAKSDHTIGKKAKSDSNTTGKKTVKIADTVDEITFSDSASNNTKNKVWMIYDDVASTATITEASDSDISLSFFDEPVTIHFHDHETMDTKEVLLYSEDAMKKVIAENGPSTRLKVLRTLCNKSKCYNVKGLRGAIGAHVHENCKKNKEADNKENNNYNVNATESCHHLEKCLNTIYIPRDRLASFGVSSEVASSEHDKIQYLVTSRFIRMFRKFARNRDGTSIVISAAKSHDWLEKSGVHQHLDSGFTREQFKIHSGVKVVLGIYEYVHYIVRMAIQKGISSRDIIHLMCKCTEPPRKIIQRVKDPLESSGSECPRNAWSQIMQHFLD